MHPLSKNGELRELKDRVCDALRSESSEFELNSALVCLIKGSLVSTILNNMINDIRTAGFESGVITSGRFLSLLSTESFDVILYKMHAMLPYIYAAPLKSTQCLIAGCGVRVTKFDVCGKGEAGYTNDVFLEHYGELLLKRHQPLFLDVDQAADFAFVSSSPHSKNQVTFLRIQSKPMDGHELAFNRNNYRLHSRYTLDAAASNILAILDLLTETDSVAMEHLLRLLSSSHHFIRWKAVQALYKMNNFEGVRVLEKMVADEHVELRAMARDALSTVDAGRGPHGHH